MSDNYFLNITIGDRTRKATRAEFEIWAWILSKTKHAADNGRIFIQPRAKAIALDLGYCKDTVLRALKALHLAGYIDKIADHRTSQRTGKTYRRPSRLKVIKRKTRGVLAAAFIATLAAVATMQPHNVWSEDRLHFVSPLTRKRVDVAAAPSGLPTATDDEKEAYKAACEAGTWVPLRDGGLLSFRKKHLAGL